MTIVTTIQASMTISAAVNKKVLDDADPTTAGVSLNLNLASILNAAFKKSWNPNTIPNGLDAWSGAVTLTAGAATIDLTNLVQVGLDDPVDATGLFLRMVVVLADANNANVIAIGVGASNGYPSIGTISKLNAGNVAVHTCQGSVAVDGTHKTLDLAGTLAQKMYVLLLFGNGS